MLHFSCVIPKWLLPAVLSFESLKGAAVSQHLAKFNRWGPLLEVEIKLE